MSFPKYESYKDSGVEWLGEMPEHWEVSPFKRFVDIQNGSDHKHVEQADGYPVLGSGGIFAYASDFLYDGESVLLGRKGTIDKPLHVTGRFWTVDTMYWSKINPDASGRFTYYLALTIPFDYYSTNTALPSMTKGSLSNHSVARPTLPEQRAIAAFLDRETSKIDDLIAEQQRLIALLTEKRQAVISHAVTKGLNPDAPMKDSGVEWLGEVPEHWEYGSLTRISKRVVVGIAEAATHAYADEGIPILRSTNIRAGKIIGEILHVDPDFAEDRESKSIRSGDLITVRTGNAGVTAVIPEYMEGCQCFTMLITTLNSNSDSQFYCYYLNSKTSQTYFSLEGWGTAQVNISVPILKCLPVPIPPLDEQRVIVSFLDCETAKIDDLITEAQRGITLLQERRSALISAAVTGKIDVRGAVA
ncbi:restriction endonuclease subunit S [Armatimonas rosea]|uniref:Type I restriction enzyme S subunit n=1 Tax=Armatimonas rosea TaxID=685828 RepID=A0A7W9WAB0_ARMRO|nr:restriction endonuclease subunit S [Armatimonas rosea]MBB6054105.1 type I restriction enzyme S subunit [Armatimonas rosea]